MPSSCPVQGTPAQPVPRRPALALLPRLHRKQKRVPPGWAQQVKIFPKADGNLPSPPARPWEGGVCTDSGLPGHRPAVPKLQGAPTHLTRFSAHLRVTVQEVAPVGCIHVTGLCPPCVGPKSPFRPRPLGPRGTAGGSGCCGRAPRTRGEEWGPVVLYGVLWTRRKPPYLQEWALVWSVLGAGRPGPRVVESLARSPLGPAVAWQDAHRAPATCPCPSCPPSVVSPHLALIGEAALFSPCPISRKQGQGGRWPLQLGDVCPGTQAQVQELPGWHRPCVHPDGWAHRDPSSTPSSGQRSSRRTSSPETAVVSLCPRTLPATKLMVPQSGGLCWGQGKGWTRRPVTLGKSCYPQELGACTAGQGQCGLHLRGSGRAREGRVCLAPHCGTAGAPHAAPSPLLAMLCPLAASEWLTLSGPHFCAHTGHLETHTAS